MGFSAWKYLVTLVLGQPCWITAPQDPVSSPVKQAQESLVLSLSPPCPSCLPLRPQETWLLAPGSGRAPKTEFLVLPCWGPQSISYSWSEGHGRGELPQIMKGLQAQGRRVYLSNKPQSWASRPGTHLPGVTGSPLWRPLHAPLPHTSGKQRSFEEGFQGPSRAPHPAVFHHPCSSGLPVCSVLSLITPEQDSSLHDLLWIPKGRTVGNQRRSSQETTWGKIKGTIEVHQD